MKRILGVLSIFFLMHCSESGNTVTFQGLLQAVQEGVVIPLEPIPTVTVLGRNADEFEVAFEGTAASAQIPFTLKDLPANQELVFQTGGTTLETVLSFPVSTSSDAAQSIPVLAGGSISAFIDLAEDDGGINIDVDTSLGIVAGIVSPSFTDSVVSTAGTVDSVRMMQKNADDPVLYQGPFYFDSGGNLVDAGSCPDAECNYIFFDVPEGTFRFQKLDSSDQVLAQQDVVVLASRLTFGME